MSRVIRYTFFFAGAFLTLHGLSLLSFFVEPLRSVLFLILLGAAAVCAFWKSEYVAIPIVLELLLDSSGHLFEWRGLSLRLLTLVAVLIAWLYHTIRARTLVTKLKTPFTLFYLIILVIVALAAYNGFLNGHDVRRIIADAIPFAYLALWYPLRDLFVIPAKAGIQFWIPDSRGGFRDDRVVGLILGSFFGAAILSIVTLFLFSSGLQEIHGPFYTWWRDWVAGKATSTGFGFYRIVTPLHLFLTALVPYIFYVILNPAKPGEGSRTHDSSLTGFFGALRLRMTLMATILLIPAINFSRIYFLAIIPATLVMIWKLPWKKVLLTLILIGTISIAEFTLINLAASRGASFGFEFLTQQSRGIIDPESEASASARAAILPHLLQKIKNHPFLGEGLGATVTYYNPFLEKELPTAHLDWGYLELAIEFGVLVALFFVALLFWLLWQNRTSALRASVLVFLLVTMLTSPALFHVYGISLIVAVLLLNNRQPLTEEGEEKNANYLPRCGHEIRYRSKGHGAAFVQKEGGLVLGTGWPVGKLTGQPNLKPPARSAQTPSGVMCTGWFYALPLEMRRGRPECN